MAASAGHFETTRVSLAASRSAVFGTFAKGARVRLPLLLFGGSSLFWSAPYASLLNNHNKQNNNKVKPAKIGARSRNSPPPMFTGHKKYGGKQRRSSAKKKKHSRKY
jgi:hypothetical protein